MKSYQVENMSVSINGEELLSNIHLNMNTAQIYGISGEANAGKTLLLNCLANNLAEYEEKPIVKNMHINFQAKLMMIEQLLLKSTALNNMRILSRQQEKISDEDSKWFLEKVGLNPQDARPVEKYSKLEKSLLAVALLLAENPSVILFDEPYTDFRIAEIKQMNQLLKSVRDMNICLLVTDESVSLLQPICQIIYQLNEGQLTRVK